MSLGPCGLFLQGCKNSAITFAFAFSFSLPLFTYTCCIFLNSSSRELFCPSSNLPCYCLWVLIFPQLKPLKENPNLSTYNLHFPDIPSFLCSLFLSHTVYQSWSLSGRSVETRLIPHRRSRPPASQAAGASRSLMGAGSHCHPCPGVAGSGTARH